MNGMPILPNSGARYCVGRCGSQHMEQTQTHAARWSPKHPRVGWVQEGKPALSDVQLSDMQLQWEIFCKDAPRPPSADGTVDTQLKLQEAVREGCIWRLRDSRIVAMRALQEGFHSGCGAAGCTHSAT